MPTYLVERLTGVVHDNHPDRSETIEADGPQAAIRAFLRDESDASAFQPGAYCPYRALFLHRDYRGRRDGRVLCIEARETRNGRLPDDHHYDYEQQHWVPTWAEVAS